MKMNVMLHIDVYAYMVLSLLSSYILYKYNLEHEMVHMVIMLKNSGVCNYVKGNYLHLLCYNVLIWLILLFRCVICQMEYKRGDKRITLPCKHLYHANCGNKWLSINKARYLPIYHELNKCFWGLFSYLPKYMFFYLICWGCFFRLALYVTQKYLPTNQNKNNGLGCVTGICFCFSSRLGFFHRNTLICLSHSKINNLVGFSWNT
jgi:hypothetical protein